MESGFPPPNSRQEPAGAAGAVRFHLPRARGERRCLRTLVSTSRVSDLTEDGMIRLLAPREVAGSVSQVAHRSGVRSLPSGLSRTSGFSACAVETQRPQ